MLINGQKVTAQTFAYDTCQKIYLLETEAETQEAIGFGYDIYRIERLQDVWDNSCELRFVSYWNLERPKLVPQFEDLDLQEDE